MFAKKSVGEVADHFEEVIRALDRKPAIIGHSFGGLLTEILAGRGLAAVTVPISPAPFRGVLPLPYSALKTASVALRNPANRNRAVPLTYDQFKYSFANLLDEDEAAELYEKYSVPGPGKVLFQAANANLNPWTEDKVDTKNPERGPMLIIAAEKDHTVPYAIANASFKREKHNEGVTKMLEFEGRGHSLCIVTLTAASHGAQSSGLAPRLDVAFEVRGGAAACGQISNLGQAPARDSACCCQRSMLTISMIRT